MRELSNYEKFCLKIQRNQVKLKVKNLKQYLDEIEADLESLNSTSRIREVEELVDLAHEELMNKYEKEDHEIWVE